MNLFPFQVFPYYFFNNFFEKLLFFSLFLCAGRIWVNFTAGINRLEVFQIWHLKAALCTQRQSWIFFLICYCLWRSVAFENTVHNKDTYFFWNILPTTIYARWNWFATFALQYRKWVNSDMKVFIWHFFLFSLAVVIIDNIWMLNCAESCLLSLLPFGNALKIVNCLIRNRWPWYCSFK